MNLSYATPMDSSTTNTTDPLSNGLSPEEIQGFVSAALRVLAQLIITGIFGVIIFIVLSFVLFPFQAVLLKYRVNYEPSQPQTEGESVADGDGSQSQSGTPAKSYTGMFHRVLKVEGWAGLYKGFVPSFVKQSLIACIVFLVILSKGGNLEKPTQSVQGQLLNKLFRMVFSLPFSIIINRAIATPQKLPWFNVSHSLRALLSETERRRPWLLYFTPGLAVTELIYEAYLVVLSRPLEAAVNVNNDNTPSLSENWPFVRLCAYMAYVIVHTTVKCLFEVVFARLSVQRNQVVPRTAPEEKVESEKSAPVLHIGNRPYTGLIDCVRRVVTEEGYTALFRAWWYDLVVGWWWLPLKLVKGQWKYVSIS